MTAVSLLSRSPATLVGLAVALVVAAWLVRQHLQQAARRRAWLALTAKHGVSPTPLLNSAANDWLPWRIGQIAHILFMAARGDDLVDDPRVIQYDEFGHTYAHCRGGVPQAIITRDPEVLKAVLATNFADFEAGEQRHELFRPLMGKSIFTTDGKEWAHYRALLRPQFSRDLINDLDGTEHACQVMITHLCAGTGPGEWTPATDLLPMFYRLSLDTVTKFLFGQSTNSQAAALGDTSDSIEATQLASSSAFADAFSTAQQGIVSRAMFGRFAGLVMRQSKVDAAFKTVHDFVDYYVRRAKTLTDKTAAQAKVKGSHDSQNKSSLAERLVGSCEDDTELRNQFVALLVAGRDTTSVLLGWALLLLALHPQEYQRLRTDVLDAVGDESQPLDFARLKGCRTVQHVLHETLRLYPAVVENNRMVLRDTVLPTGGGPNGDEPIALLKETFVGWSIHHMHRRRDLWGDDAPEFRPLRWAARKQGWSFLPFNGGPRICLGQQYALTEAAYVLTRIVQRFDRVEAAFGDAPGGPRPAPVWQDLDSAGRSGWQLARSRGVTQAPLHGVVVKMRRAGE